MNIMKYKYLIALAAFFFFFLALNITFNNENGESTVKAGTNTACAQSGNNWASCNDYDGQGNSQFISCNGCTTVRNAKAGDPNLCKRDDLAVN